MIKRIEKWLAGIFQKELAAAAAEIAALRAELTTIHAELKAHTLTTAKDVQTHAENVASELFEDLTKHAEETAVQLHTKIAADAKTILRFQQAARLSCSWCGQLSRTYIIDPITQKIKCADCQKKGVE